MLLPSDVPCYLPLPQGGPRCPSRRQIQNTSWLPLPPRRHLSSCKFWTLHPRCMSSALKPQQFCWTVPSQEHWYLYGQRVHIYRTYDLLVNIYLVKWLFERYFFYKNYIWLLTEIVPYFRHIQDIFGGWCNPPSGFSWTWFWVITEWCCGT